MEAAQAKISIILPFRNAAPWILDCLHSIQAQAFSQWELIAINDHSTDQTEALIISLRDSRIQIVSNEGQGIVDALVTGFGHCTGVCITRMDADDEMPADRLARMWEALEEAPPKTLVTGLVQYFPKGEISEGYQKYQEWLNDINLTGQQWANVYRECVIASPNWMMRTVELREIGGFAGLTYPEDYDLVFRWYRHGFRIAVVPETTLLWREHPQRTSRTSVHYAQEAFFHLKMNQFIQNEYLGGPLVIWGKNEKSRLTTQILSAHGVTPLLLDLENYREITRLQHPQLLVAVYPPEDQRKVIAHYLDSIGMVPGENYWYL